MMKAVRPDKGQPLWAGVFTVSGHDPSAHILVDKAGKQLDRKVPLGQLKLAGHEVADLDRIDRIVAHKSAGQLHKLPNRPEAEILSRPVDQVLFVGDDAPYPADWYFAEQLDEAPVAGYIRSCEVTPGTSDPVLACRLKRRKRRGRPPRKADA